MVLVWKLQDGIVLHICQLQNVIAVRGEVVYMWKLQDVISVLGIMLHIFQQQDVIAGPRQSDSHLPAA